jgi:1-acyl-sn-glycerol-3-phosphate acyltransferase
VRWSQSTRNDLRDSRHGSLLFSLWVLTILSAALPSLWILLHLSRSRSQADGLVRAYARGVLLLSGCRLEVVGLGHLVQAGRAVIVANHSSALDSVVLLASLPGPYRFVVNHLAATRPLIGLAIRKCGHLVVDRTSLRSKAACGRAMFDMLESKVSLVIFPEGTRSDAALLPFKTGAFRVAATARAPVIPVAVSGTREILPRQFRLLHRGSIQVRILPSIAPPVGEDAAAALRDAAWSAIDAARV